MKVGFIGCGNMAKAMIKGMIHSKVVSTKDLYAYDVIESNVIEMQEELNIQRAMSNKELVNNCEVIILAIKPHFYESVVTEIFTSLKECHIIVSIAPNYTLPMLQDILDKETKIIRCMPNTPAMVLEGMSAICVNEFISKEELNEVRQLITSFSKCEIVDESMMPAVIALSGSSPAYVFMMIEAMADAGVKQGMPRDLAYTFAAQAVYGSAKMVMETGIHPAQLKDMVCSPKGTTIEAVQVLEEKGFRSALMEAMQACAKKATTM